MQFRLITALLASVAVTSVAAGPLGAVYARDEKAQQDAQAAQVAQADPKEKPVEPAPASHQKEEHDSLSDGPVPKEEPDTSLAGLMPDTIIINNPLNCKDNPLRPECNRNRVYPDPNDPDFCLRTRDPRFCYIEPTINTCVYPPQECAFCNVRRGNYWLGEPSFLCKADFFTENECECRYYTY